MVEPNTRFSRTILYQEGEIGGDIGDVRRVAVAGGSIDANRPSSDEPLHERLRPRTRTMSPDVSEPNNIQAVVPLDLLAHELGLGRELRLDIRGIPHPRHRPGPYPAMECQPEDGKRARLNDGSPFPYEALHGPSYRSVLGRIFIGRTASRVSEVDDDVKAVRRHTCGW